MMNGPPELNPLLGEIEPYTRANRSPLPAYRRAVFHAMVTTIFAECEADNGD